MRKYLCLSYLLAIPAVLMQARLHWTLRQDRQQPAGEEGPCPEPTGAGRVVEPPLLLIERRRCRDKNAAKILYPRDINVNRYQDFYVLTTYCSTSVNLHQD